MLKVRIIPLLLLKGNSLVKSVSFADHRIVGDAMSTIKVFSRRFADEMIILDLDARDKGIINTELLKRISAECNMPLTFGGGIDSVEKADQAFYSGADKITINSAFFKKPEIIKKIVDRYGSQSIVLSLDVKRQDNDFIIYYNNASKIVTDLNLEQSIEKANMLGIGEILVNDINRDGMMNGLDLDLIETLRSRIKLPLIVAGGCADMEDFNSAFKLGVDGIAAGSIFHWIGESIVGIKTFLKDKDINVRTL